MVQKRAQHKWRQTGQVLLNHYGMASPHPLHLHSPTGYLRSQPESHPHTCTHPTFTPALIPPSHPPILPHIRTHTPAYHTLTPSHHLITTSYPLTLSHPHTIPSPSPPHPHTFPPTIPLSLRAVSMTITEMFCSHTICQNSPTVSTRGACATIYSGLDECVSYCKERSDTRVFTSWCDL